MTEGNGADGEVTLTLDAAIVAGDSADTVGAVALEIYDALDNSSATATMAVVVDELPELSSLSTIDKDGDGYVDRLIATFDEAVNEAALVPGNFSTDIGTVNNVVTNGTVDVESSPLARSDR